MIMLLRLLTVLLKFPLGQNFDHWEIPKTHKSLVIFSTSKNTQFRLKYHHRLKMWEVEIS